MRPNTDAYTLACIIHGEGATLGPIGLYAVASTIAERLRQGQSLERIDREYYGNDAERGGCTSPGPVAQQLAAAITRGEVAASGYAFIYSKRDVERGRFPPADFVLMIGGGGDGHELHLYREWPVKGQTA
jgi:hypothetical protein